METPSWFDEQYYAQQKAAQMNAIGWRDAEGHAKRDWTAADWPNELARYNREHGTDFSAYDNFLACNTSNYVAGIPISAVNVSATPLLDVPVYLTNVAILWNFTGYSAGGYSAGEWTAETAMRHMFNDLRMSAWEHYTDVGMKLRINPSNDFDTGAYLSARAQAMGGSIRDAIQEMTQNGINPIEDCAVFGKQHNIQPAAAQNPVTPQISQSQLWSAPQTNPEPDQPGGDEPGSSEPPYVPPYFPPYLPVDPEPEPEPAVKKVVIEKGDFGPYYGNYGEDTQFAAVWIEDDAKSTLDARDVITGGLEADNSLAIELGKDWDGFSGKDSADREIDNVRNVQTIVLNREEGLGDTPLTFNAAGISEDATSFELNGDGRGTISLSGLSANAQTVNIKDMVGDIQLDYADARPEKLTIGLKDIPFADEYGYHSLNMQFSGIKDVTVNAAQSTDAYADGYITHMDQVSGLEKLTLTGEHYLYIQDLDATNLQSIDASNMADQWNVVVKNLQDNIPVNGGSGFSTLTFGDNVEIANAPWQLTSLGFRDGGKVDLAQATGIHQIDLWGANAVELSNLTGNDVWVSDLINVYQADEVHSTEVKINGNIKNLTYSTAMGGDYADDTIVTQRQPHLESNATGDFRIWMNGNDTLAAGSVFRVPEIDGHIYIANPNPYLTPASDEEFAGITLQAGKALELGGYWAGTFYLNGNSDLASLKSINMEMFNGGTEDNPDLFSLDPGLNLPNLEYVEIFANDTGVNIYGDIGGSSDLDIHIYDASRAQFGNVHGAGKDISIEAYTTMAGFDFEEIGQADNPAGNVRIVASGATVLDPGHTGRIFGKDLDLDFHAIDSHVGSFSQVEGQKGDALVLSAQGKIDYIGSAKGDLIKINSVGADSESEINLNGGRDALILRTKDSIGAGNTAWITVNLGDESAAGDGDYLNLAQSTAGNLWIDVQIANEYVDSFIRCRSMIENEGDLAAADQIGSHLATVAQVNTALDLIGAEFHLGEDAPVENGTFTLNGSAYWIDANVNGEVISDVTLVCVAGADVGVFA